MKNTHLAMGHPWAVLPSLPVYKMISKRMARPVNPVRRSISSRRAATLSPAPS